jgi:acyl-[acyl-carrier-protein]-phospholipid O-acyltransferase/long-chain-fatty-acid--[acyl-carrier-protein] ligase
VSIFDGLIGLLALLWTRLAYRLRAQGTSQVPATGPAIIAINHTSLIDRLFIYATLPRKAWFYGTTRERFRPILSTIGRALHSDEPEDIPSTAEAIALADRLASEALARGEIVCIFPEGRMTRLGHLIPFTPTFANFLAQHPQIPVVPAYILGNWLSMFSFYRYRYLGKWPSLKRSWITVVYGPPLPASHGSIAVRSAIQEASAQAYEASRYDRIPVHRKMIYTSKKFGRRLATADSNTPAMNYATLLMRTAVLTRLLNRRLDKSECVGVFLPSSVGGLVTNIALTLMGRIPVNLNYTIGQDVLDKCIEQASIKQVLTSKLFLDKVGLQPNAELIMLEGLRKDVKTTDKLFGLIARIMPAWFVDYILFGLGKASIDDTATIVFSSGSTGDPKGVILTHHNVMCNAEQMLQHTNTFEEDIVLGVLPFFHSFGYTVTMWVPSIVGCGVIYHFNPLEADAVSKIARQHQPTMFFATSTFLRNYIRKCEKEDFQALRMLVCGAEKLQPATANEFEAKFGLYPSEGYGCTELSPVVTVNRPNQISTNFEQIGTRRGYIGHPLPGIAVSIRDIDTKEPLPLGSEGLLWVKGPNVMKGYLHKPDLTAEAIQDGWYNTGDIALVEEDGFVRITDRLARFSKIGGEMVPHSKIEEKLHHILKTNEPTVVVVGLPDKRKGERLIVVHAPMSMSPEHLWTELKESGVPSIWLPSKTDFFGIEQLPVLGTGKIDLKGVKKIAAERVNA